MRRVLEDMPERIWNFEREMVERELGDRLDLSLNDGSDEMDNEVGFVDH